MATQKTDAVDGKDENEPLRNENENTATSYTYPVAIFLTAFALYFTGCMSYFYIVSQWIHHYEQSRIMPNGTMNSSATCGRENLTYSDQALYENVESETAKWQMFNNVGNFLPSVITMSFLPAYSDCFGRRFIILVGSTGTLIKFIISTFVIYYDWHPLFAILAAVIEGCSGGFCSVISGGYSYLADLTEVGRKRTFALTLFDSANATCICVAGICTGYFVQYVGYSIPSATACGMVACSYILFLFAVPESYPRHMRSTTKSLWAVLKMTFSFYVSDVFKEKRTAYVLLLLVLMLQNLTSGPRNSLELLYQLGRPFCWSPDKIGIFAALRNLTRALIGMFILKPLQSCFSDLTIAILSMVFGMGSFVIEGFAQTDLMMYLVLALAAFAFLCEPMIKGLMSTITPPNKQGSLFSSIILIQVTNLVLANFIFNTIYANTVSFMSGFIFLLQAGIVLLAITVLVVFRTVCQKVLRLESNKLVDDTDD